MTRSFDCGFELDRLKRVIEGIGRTGELAPTRTLIVLGSARPPASPAPTLSRRLKPAAVAIRGRSMVRVGVRYFLLISRSTLARWPAGAGG